MIFPVLFYHEGEQNANNAFQDALRESLYTDQTWPGMACEMSQINDCIVSPSQFGIDIFPAYVFLRRVEDDAENAVMVKKIEGKELGTDELISEIEDAYRAVFDIDAGNGFTDEDGDGKPDAQVNLPARPGFRLGNPLGAYFGCADVLPDWICRVKIGYILLLILLIALMVVVIKKA
ncbi:hypothetical protein [Phaeodactylibacter sp.]|uniref:hypothetical protein n=1 Tax=Phaeodactylibacter sp. TaxID=1940289 RepID=UPI0025F6E8DC|nr:hypothetical protein [Phaeodactylibacter sp.]MCI4650858.1 hypothetical protein [Phaeodactylibacter sp.]MCI5089815.1 hypothetical protein [Phaeodactylibacter sp.]